MKGRGGGGTQSSGFHRIPTAKCLNAHLRQRFAIYSVRALCLPTWRYCGGERIKTHHSIQYRYACSTILGLFPYRQSSVVIAAIVLLAGL